MKRKPKRKLRAMALKIDLMDRQIGTVMTELTDLFEISERLSLRLTEIEQPMEEPSDER